MGKPSIIITFWLIAHNLVILGTLAASRQGVVIMETTKKLESTNLGIKQLRLDTFLPLLAVT